MARYAAEFHNPNQSCAHSHWTLAFLIIVFQIQTHIQKIVAEHSQHTINQSHLSWLVQSKYRK